MDAKRYAIILAGGSGMRMGSEVPKQFLSLSQRPILLRTFEIFEKLSQRVEIVLVLPRNYVDYWKELCCNFKRDNLKCVISYGGITRFHSVKNALSKISDNNALVAIHDGVRPFVTIPFLEHCYETAALYGSAIPVTPVVQSVRRIDGPLETPVFTLPIERENLYMVQTPQVFNVGDIKRAYDLPYEPHFTDDATVAEASGIKLTFMEGLSTNIKITTPADLAYGESLLGTGPLSQKRLTGTDVESM